MTKGDATERAVGLIEAAVGADGLSGFASGIVPLAADVAGADGAFVYISDPRLPTPHSAFHGLSDDEIPAVGAALDEWFDALGEDRVPSDSTAYALHGLPVDGRVIGMIGLAGTDGGSIAASGVWRRLLATLGRVADRLAAQASAERKLLHLNTYLTVSSMLAKSVDLAELLEIALYCSMEAASAEAASILLLDEAKENFEFYRVEGSAKPLLGGSTFPASEGVAGRVLETLEAEIVNDVETDPRFYEQIDMKTGYRTRNLIAIPLVAGDEPVGVLEVLNRVDGGPFTPDERLILVSVADEIAFAVRNATIFDYVVNTYCRRRQGQNSCKGCERPLGSWTPCMRYREFLP